tara:strand:+ start:1007 stop:1339 length:333 start_codon:yes stop_codon:yes gene_type:complete
MELQPPRFDPYSTLQQSVDEFAAKGYKDRFDVISSSLMRNSKGKEYKPEELAINEIKRILNKENQSQKVVIYAVVTNTGEKGILIDHYGENGTEEINEFLLSVENQDPRS